MDVVVMGQIARDLVLRVPAVPGPGATAAVGARWEGLGGKGANQAVALAQLGLRPALLGVVGDDRHGAQVRAQAAADGVDVGPVVVRPGTCTALIVDVLDEDARWRYLEDVPDATLVGPADVAAHAARLGAAAVVVLQLQQPGDAVAAAARHAHAGGARVVLDGAPPDPAGAGALLSRAAVLRADDAEAELWAGGPLRSVEQVRLLARDLVRRGPGLVVLGAGRAGNVAAWPDGDALLPLGDADVVDTTGAGDAFTAGIVAALDGGPRAAAERGSAAAARTVGHPGGRPRLR